MSNVIKNSKYIKSDVNKNNNKFWYITLYDDSTVELHWGRVGDAGQKKIKDFGSQTSADSFFEKKCKEKVRAGRNGEIAYRPLNVIGNGETNSNRVISKSNLKNIALNQIKSDSTETKKLIEYLADQNIHDILSSTVMTYNKNTGLFSTPCGIVSQHSIDEANVLLKKMFSFVQKKEYSNKNFVTLAGNYLMLIPQKVGRKLDLESLFPSVSSMRKQKSLLDSLQVSLDSVLSTNDNSNTRQKAEEKVFSANLNILRDISEVKRIKNLYRNTKNKMHMCRDLDIKTIWTLDIKDVKNRFDNCPINNIIELWHGSSSSNCLSILKSGLKMPSSSSSNVTGRMFSSTSVEGLYFSDQSTKALNYSAGFWNGKRTKRVFMFLADVRIGRYYVPRGSFDGPFPKRGYDSTFAKASQSGVRNNEIIVYSLDQVNLKNIIEFC